MAPEAIVVSGSAAKLERGRALGASHGIDRMAVPEWGRLVRDLTRGRSGLVIQVGAARAAP